MNDVGRNSTNLQCSNCFIGKDLQKPNKRFLRFFVSLVFLHMYNILWICETRKLRKTSLCPSVCTSGPLSSGARIGRRADEQCGEARRAGTTNERRATIRRRPQRRHWPRGLGKVCSANSSQLGYRCADLHACIYL